MGHRTFVRNILFCLFSIKIIDAQNVANIFGSFNSGPFSINWTTSEDFNTFSLATQATDSQNAYTAIGFSNDRLMGDDGVVYCTYDNNVGNVFQGYNKPDNKQDGPKFLNDSIKSIGITKQNVRMVNGILLCSFQRQKRNPNVDNYFDLSKQYFILCARGPTSNGAITYHGAANRLASNEKINFQTNSSSSSIASISNDKLKAHGCLMAFTWMFLASTGILFARYYKFIFPTIRLFKLHFWFNIHRPFMICVPLISIIAFIVILADLNWKWVNQINKVNYAHSIIGIITICLSIIQIPIALARPTPDHPKRYIFNYTHRTVGLSAFLLSIVTLFLGVCIERANLGSSGWGIMIGYTLWIVILPIILEILFVYFKNLKEDSFTVVNSNNLKMNTMSERSQKKFENIKSVLLVLHLIITFSFAIALVVIIGIQR